MLQNINQKKHQKKKKLINMIKKNIKSVSQKKDKLNIFYLR